MASITFSGQLDQAMNEAAAEGNKILFIPQQTVGEVLPGAASELVVESDGTYSITLAYNTYSIYHYSDVTKRRTLLANDIVVSADTVVSTIPDLIGSTVPVTEDGVLTIQGYLTDAQNSATAAAASEEYVSGVVDAGHSALTGRDDEDSHPSRAISNGDGKLSDSVSFPWSNGSTATANASYRYKADGAVAHDVYCEADNVMGESPDYGTFIPTRGELNLKDFASVEAAFTAMDESGIMLNLGHGDVRPSSEISLTNHFMIKGNHPRSSRIIWDDAGLTTGIDYAYNSTQARSVSVSDVGFYKDGVIGGTAISIDGSSGGSYPDISRGSLFRCVFEGLSRETTSEAFETCIYTKNVTGLDMYYLLASGINNSDTSSGLFYGTFINQDDDDSNSEVSSHHSMTNCQATRFNIAAKCSSSEGFYFLNNRFFNVDYGVDYDNGGLIDADGFAPRFSWIGGHISAKVRAIKAYKAATTHIESCNLLYTLSSDDYGFKFIELDNCSGGVILGNKIGSNYDLDVNGIRLNNSTDILIDNNNFVGNGGRAVESVNSRYNNFGSGNKVRYSWSGATDNDSDSWINCINGGLTIRKTSSQSISGTTTIEFDSVWKETNGNEVFFNPSVSKTDLNIPVGGGRYRVCVKLLATGGSNGDNIRTNIEINGTNSIGSGVSTIVRSSYTAQTLELTSDDINLSQGDVVTVTVQSDGELTIGTNSTVSLVYLSDY